MHCDVCSSFRVSVAELTEQHVIRYEVEKDLLPLVLSNCQYSLERGHETISQYDLPRIQQQILDRFLRGKPLITRTVSPHSLVCLVYFCRHCADSSASPCTMQTITDLLRPVASCQATANQDKGEQTLMFDSFVSGLSHFIFQIAKQM